MGNSTLNLITFVVISLLISACSKVNNKKESTINISNKQDYTEIKDSIIDHELSIPDSSIIYQLDYFCLNEKWNIDSCQILLKNDSSILNIRVIGGNTNCNLDIIPKKIYTQFILNRSVSDCLKKLLDEIYSEHDSALKDGIPNERFVISSVQDELSLHINLGDKKIMESFHVLEICESYEDIEPFRPQFYKVMDLIYAILYKIYNDYYNPNRTFETPDWIVEEFNYDYYEPYK